MNLKYTQAFLLVLLIQPTYASVQTEVQSNGFQYYKCNTVSNDKLIKYHCNGIETENKNNMCEYTLGQFNITHQNGIIDYKPLDRKTLKCNQPLDKLFIRIKQFKIKASELK